MPTPQELYGSDLGLLRSPATGDSRDPGNDLLTRGAAGGSMDLETWSGLDNLEQALLLRFLTPAGALTDLGHPDYGSRLFELIGRLNNDTSRNLAKLYVLLALSEEPRVQRVISVDVAPSPAFRDQINITVNLVTLRSPSVLNLVFPFSLAGGVGP
jgi:phage baseplate assembly protein W